jgi:glycosyltransferase involved in cell wall biosynthesis
MARCRNGARSVDQGPTGEVAGAGRPLTQFARKVPLKGCRIAILGTRGIPACYGGFETFAEQLSVRLVQLGCEVTVYAETDRSDESAHMWRGVRVQPIQVPRWGPASVIGYDLRCLWDARRQFDLVYMLGYGAAFACALPRLYGVPVWINVDGLEWARSKWNWLARRYLRTMEWVASRSATRVIADAEVIAQRFRQLYPRGAVCSYVAYGAPLVYGGECPSVSDLMASEAYFLVVARMEPENHVLEILEGYRLYRRKGGVIPLCIVGDHTRNTDYCETLRACAGEGMHLLGAIHDQTRLQALRVGALAYLHGHSVGGTNPSLLEALGCGSVVVAHDNPFNREVLGENADYFQDPEDIAAALDALTRLPVSELQNRRQVAHCIIAERYTWEHITHEYQRLLLADIHLA